jgi:protein TonB
MLKKLTFMIIAALLVLGPAVSPAQDQDKGAQAKPARSEKNKDVSEPVLLSKVNPSYPAAAKEEKVTGPVELEITVGADGSVVEANALKSPDPRLSAAAVEAIKQWKFKPARTKEGKAVQVKATITVNFKLQ